MRLRRLICVPATLACAAAVAGPTTASAAPLGSLSQLPGGDGCVTANTANAQNCRISPAVDSAFQVAPSPDGKHVYAGGAFFSGGNFGGFTRGPAGGLTPIAGACFVAADAPAGCTAQRGLDGVSDVEVSPDGRHVYVLAYGQFSTGDETITTYTRNAQTGELTPVAGEDGCVSSASLTGCRAVHDIEEGATLTFSPDSEFLYVANAADVGGAVAVLDRDPANGRLTQPAGQAGCIHQGAATADCEAGRGLDNAYDIAITRDGERMYVAGGVGNGTVAVLARDTQTGKLTQLAGTIGCVTGGAATADCATARGMGMSQVGEPYGVALSPDDESLYVTAPGGFSDGHDTLTVFGVDGTTGALTQPAGEAGCLMGSFSNAPPTEGCGTARGLVGLYDIVVSPDGNNVYTVAYRQFANAGAVGVYDRAADGTLTQMPAPHGCVTSGGDAGCVAARGAAGPNGIAISPDGETVYVAAFDDSAVTVLTREAPPVCSNSQATAVSGQTVQLPLACREPNGQGLAYELVSGPQHGSLGAIDAAGGTVAYTPQADYEGADAIGYRASDGDHESAVATLAIDVRRQPSEVRPPDEVRPPNRAVFSGPAKLRASKRGTLSVALTCAGTAGTRCGGELSLESAKKLRLKPGSKRKLVSFGSAPYGLEPGATQEIEVKLPRKAAKALAALRKVALVARTQPADGTDPAELRLTAKAAKRKG